MDQLGPGRRMFQSLETSALGESLPCNLFANFRRPLVFDVEEVAMDVFTNDISKTIHVVRRNYLLMMRDFDRKVSCGKWIRQGPSVRIIRLALELLSCHAIAEYVELGRKGKFIKILLVILVTFNVCQLETSSNSMRRAERGQKVSVVGVAPFGNPVSNQFDITDGTSTIDIELERAADLNAIEGGKLVEI